MDELDRRPFWKDLRFIVGAITVPVFVALLIILSDLVNRPPRSPEVDLVGVARVAPGEEVDISGKNLDLVSEVLLTRGSTTFHIPFIRTSESRLTVTVHNRVDPGEYNLEFSTISGKNVATGRTLVVNVDPVPPGPTPEALTPIPEPPTSGPFSVTITKPVDGAKVPMEITVKGTINGPVPDERSLWVVVGIGGLWFPQIAQLSPFPKSGSTDLEWNVPAIVGIAGDEGKDFTILAVLTNSSIDQQFFDWFGTGKITGSYPGFEIATLLSQGAQIMVGISVERS